MTCRTSALRAVSGTLRVGLIGGLLLAFEVPQFPPLGTGVSADEKVCKLYKGASAQGAGPDLESAVRAEAIRRVSRASRLVVDGKLDEPRGGGAWTDAFVDIEGDRRPRPRFRPARRCSGTTSTSTSPPRWRSRTSGRR